VETLDGVLEIKIPAGVSHGELLRVKGKGVPVNQNRRGDLLIRVVIRLPEKLSRKAKELVEKLRGEGI
jgi:DnaJ-class molecular chaperone